MIVFRRSAKAGIDSSTARYAAFSALPLPVRASGKRRDTTCTNGSNWARTAAMGPVRSSLSSSMTQTCAAGKTARR